MYWYCRGKGAFALAVLLLLVNIQVASGSDLALLDAARADNGSLLQSILESRKVNVNQAAQADGTTALIWAVYNDNPDTVELLIKHGADVNAATIYGVTSLTLACLNKNADIIRILLAARANPNIAKHTGESPLMTCSLVGNVDGVRELLAHGADINAKENAEGQTALMWAIAEKHTEVVSVLIEKGADVNIRSKELKEPDGFFVDIPPDLSVLARNLPETVRFPAVRGGFTPLYFAAQQGDLESARMLIQSGADINAPHKEYGNALNIAIASGHEELAHYLVDQGAEVNVKDGWGITPLHYALHEGVLYLNSFQPSTTDRFGWQRKNMPNLVKKLVDAGADVDARIEYSYAYLSNPFIGRAQEDPPQVDPVGATPLLLAAASGDTESMRILIEAGGADRKATTIGGGTVFMLAAGVGVERGARNEKQAIEAAELALAIDGGDVNGKLVEIAVGGPSAGMQDGRTALHAAVTLGWMDMVRFLVDNGADINARDRYEMSPLEFAMGDPAGRYYRQVGSANYDDRYRRTTRENKRMVDLLLELGAEPFTGTYRDMTGE